jgi:MFS family permease
MDDMEGAVRLLPVPVSPSAARPVPVGGEVDGGARDEKDEEREEDEAADAEASLASLASAPLSSSSYDRANAQVAPLRLRQLLALNGVWLAFQLFWFVLLIVTLPSQALRIVGTDAKGYAMFVIFMVGGTLNLLASLVFGYGADRMYSRWGRRYVWLIGSTVLLVPFLIAVAAAATLAALTLLYAAIFVVTTGVSVAFNGLVADVVHRAQRGRASAIMGAMGVAGYVLGAVLGLVYTSIGDYGMYGILSGVLLGSVALAYWTVPEPPFTRADLARVRLQDAGPPPPAHTERDTRSERQRHAHMHRHIHARIHAHT